MAIIAKEGFAAFSQRQKFGIPLMSPEEETVQIRMKEEREVRLRISQVAIKRYLVKIGRIKLEAKAL